MPSNIKLVTYSGLSALSATQLQVLCDGLPAVDRERAQALKSDRRLRQFVLGRALLQLALLKFCNLPMRMRLQDGGKPEVDGASVSISHSGDSVAIALCPDAENPLGVDVEVYKARNFMRLARHYFASEEVLELESLSGVEQSRCFFRIWVLKESLAKFTGKGLGRKILRSPFTSFSAGQGGVSFYMCDTDYALGLTAAKDSRVDSYEARLCGGDIELVRQTRQFSRLSPPIIED